MHVLRLSRIAGRHHERRQILRQAGLKAQHRKVTDADKLVDAADTTDQGVVADRHMTSKLDRIGDDVVITDHTVMRHMHISHDPVVIADLGEGLVLHRARVEGSELANGVAVTDDQSRGLAFVLLVLWVSTQGRKLEDLVVTTDGGVPLDHTVRTNAGAFTDTHVRTNGRERPHSDGVSQLRLRIDDGAGMDVRHLRLRTPCARCTSVAPTRPILRPRKPGH